MIDFAKVLNAEQCAAATAPNGPLLVLAAAGTGKTRTLVHRVAYLLEQGIPAERVLLLTFTNRAAREMLERAENLIPNVAGIWSGTFHSICARFLRRYGSFLGYKPSFTILDEEDQKKLITACIKAHVKVPKDFIKKELLLKIISDAKNREWDFRKLVYSYQTKTALNADEVIRVGEAYEEKKRELGAMDFDDLLVNGLRLLREVPSVCQHLQEQFLHVLVDEYQDTNTLQAKFTDILAAKHHNLMVVGDDFQCIYTWRGAQFENIMEFPKRWPGCRIIKLERNYRSLAPILDVANVVMKDVQNAFEKTLRPFRAGSAIKPRLYTMYDGYVQAETILKIIRALHGQGTPYKDIAVLYRSHYTSIDIQLTLTRNHIPFRITSGVGVFEQMHVKDVLAFLRLCLDAKAELSFYRVMTLLPGVGEASVRKWWQKLGNSFDGTNGMDRMNLGAMMSTKGKSGWEGIANAFANAAEHLKNKAGNKLVLDFVQLFYSDHLHKQFDEDEAEQRLEDLNEITAQIALNPGGLEGFLNEVALMTNLDARAQATLPADHLQLSTIHQAKGMEWPVVILPWLVESVFPSARSVEDGNTAEERRLFYVAVTRAKDRLYMSAPRTKKMADGGMLPVEPSIFIREIPGDLLEKQEIHSYSPEAVQRSYTHNDSFGGWGKAYPSSHAGSHSKTTYKTEWRH